MDKQKFDMLVENTTYTFLNFIEKIKNSPKYKLDEVYSDTVRAILLAAKQNGHCDCFDIDDFINTVKNGYIKDYDGIGEFIDQYGNKLKAIYCDEKWLNKNKPKNAKYIMWYNK